MPWPFATIFPSSRATLALCVTCGIIAVRERISTALLQDTTRRIFFILLLLLARLMHDLISRSGEAVQTSKQSHLSSPNGLWEHLIQEPRFSERAKYSTIHNTSGFGFHLALPVLSSILPFHALP